MIEGLLSQLAFWGIPVVWSLRDTKNSNVGTFQEKTTQQLARFVVFMLFTLCEKKSGQNLWGITHNSCFLKHQRSCPLKKKRQVAKLLETSDFARQSCDVFLELSDA